MALDHKERRRWCSEISDINKNLNPSDSKKGKEVSILEMIPDKQLRRRV